MKEFKQYDGDLDDDQLKVLNHKIKTLLHEEMMTFTLKDGKLMAVGHFPAGCDTIGFDDGSPITWEMLMKQ